MIKIYRLFYFDVHKLATIMPVRNKYYTKYWTFFPIIRSIL